MEPRHYSDVTLAVRIGRLLVVCILVLGDSLNISWFIKQVKVTAKKQGPKLQTPSKR